MKKKNWKKATKEIEKGENILEERKEWLLVADFHGYDVANRFSGMGELVEEIASTEKRERLEIALSGANKRPFLPGTPAAGHLGGAGRPSMQTPSIVQHKGSGSSSTPSEGHRKDIVCLRCRKQGHIARFCTEPLPASTSSTRKFMS